MSKRKSYVEDFEEKERGVLHEILSFLIYVAVVVGATFLIIHFVGQRTYVSGSSMENTLSDGDNLIVDKITYRFSDPQRFDIIVFPFRYEDHVYYIKRIIGLPGETVQISEGKILIDGEEMTEDIYVSDIEYAGEAEQPVKLGDDEYFVIGDNHAASDDSRLPGIGAVSRDEIYGEAWFVASPGDDFGFI